MKAYANEENKKTLERLKLEIATFKKNLNPNQKITYPKKIIEELKILIFKGMPCAFIARSTGVPVSNLYSWRSKHKNKKEKKVNGFNQLKIVKEIKSIPVKTESKIGVSLGDDITLSIPLEFMGPILKILKEEWHVTRI